MAASDGSPLKQQRIPAWKRIGLKLKFAKEEAEEHSHASRSNVPVASATPTANDNDNHSTDDVRPPKRRKTSSNPVLKSQPHIAVANGATRNDSIGDEQQALLGAHSERADVEFLAESRGHGRQSFHSAAPSRGGDTVETKKRRKSVTFAPQTKAEDGLGASTLAAQTELDAHAINEATIAIEASPGKTKKPKKQRNRRTVDSLNGPDADKSQVEKVPEYVRYLELFHADKGSWKFNKKKQTDLLKNLFNIEQLPSEHNEAIVDYISGLSGIGARQRVAESATAVLKHIAEIDIDYDSEQHMETEEARRAAYSAALRRHLERTRQAGVGSTEYDDQQIAEMKQETEKGQRAEAILGDLLRKELCPNEQPAPAPRVPSTDPPRSISDARSETSTTNSSKQKPMKVSKRKKRKQRTQGAPDNSSSDSSESEGEYTPKRGPATVHQALSILPEPKLKDPPTTAKSPATKVTGTKKIFDDDLLDQMFPNKPTYHETAPKRKAGETPKVRGFAYTHGTRVDESGSEDDE